MSSGTTELAKVGWFLLGVGWILVIRVMWREIPSAIKTIMHELRGQAVGDTVQIVDKD
ncbi:MAG: hypothetical protein WBH35_06595 [Bacillota bacterium]|jgi:hypothetical protein|nr:hypothetical protein [Bacillota bacterium]HPZ54026.1 hypothetical protein [Bacillota bacterium]HQD17497.1 hypothetical protein [Bacillota bacterium]